MPTRNPYFFAGSIAAASLVSSLIASYLLDKDPHYLSSFIIAIILGILFLIIVKLLNKSVKINNK